MKRLILCCDGTWHDAEHKRPGNVLRLAQSLSPRDADNCAQVVYFVDSGIPAHVQHLDWDRFCLAIDQDIQQAYRFLVHNYDDGDEIWCFGFSRGAYILRSLLGLLRNAWLLERTHVERLGDAYHVYRTLWGADADNALRFREQWCRQVPVHWLGVWDTVGSHGIPEPLLRGIDAERYAFHDNRLSSVVRQARQALAIDERRLSHVACPWRVASGGTHAEQCWFSGSHGDIGGICRDGGLAAISLRWMCEEASRCGLAFDPAALDAILGSAGPETLHRQEGGPWPELGCDWRHMGGHIDETLHSSAEQRLLRNEKYNPPNLRAFLDADEQLRLPL